MMRPSAPYKRLSQRALPDPKQSDRHYLPPRPDSGEAEIWPPKQQHSRPTKPIAKKCSPSPHSWSHCVRRGEVYRFRTPKGVGHEQQGVRYGVVVQADELLPRSVVIVAPTSRSARSASFRPEITVAGDTTLVLVEQLGAVDVQRLGDVVGYLSADELWSIDDALITVLGLA
ncbi:MAG: mRNA interferase MazF [Candidatus Aldehydirespiratoraceae bacterium]|jgi:mRNA interferase MazF